MCTGLLFCFRERPHVSNLSLDLRLNSESLVLYNTAVAPYPRLFPASGSIERTLRPLSFSLLHPAHVEKHLLNSGRLRGLMPTYTEKQTVLNTHRETHRYKRTHTGTSPDKNHTWMDTHRHASTRIPRNTQILATYAATDTLKNTTMRGFAVLLGAHTRWHATLSPDPRDSPVAQPRPIQAAPPSKEPSPLFSSPFSTSA